ncbi:MAG: DUF4159 domain-containing protein, partial [Candidatus Diapherotrites archaeon]|nr:DUF4159 domain-containing protein [Candidatus Diapherotrites archaeon]
MKTRIVCLLGVILCHWPVDSAAQGAKTNATDTAAAPQKKSTVLTFKQPSFTFVRVRYTNQNLRGWTWATDFPDADLAISTRFQKETGLKTNPEVKVAELTDPNLKDYPFLYIAEPGDMELNPTDASKLREYLLGGGFLMVDDFWGERQWKGFYRQFKKVFPDREPVDLSIDHPIFHCLFDL